MFSECAIAVARRVSETFHRAPNGVLSKVRYITMNGDYEFHSVGTSGEETEVIYDLDVDLLVRLPGFVKRRAESKIVHAAVDDLKDRLEAEN